MYMGVCERFSRQGSSPGTCFMPLPRPMMEGLSCSCSLSGVIWPALPGCATSETQHYYQSSLTGLQPIWLLPALHLKRLSLFPYPGAFQNLNSVWPEYPHLHPENSGRAKERARASTSLNHSGEGWIKEGNASQSSVFAGNRMNSGGKQKNRHWLDMAQVPPKSKPEATYINVRSYRATVKAMAGSQGPKKESQGQKKKLSL